MKRINKIKQVLNLALDKQDEKLYERSCRLFEFAWNNHLHFNNYRSELVKMASVDCEMYL